MNIHEVWRSGLVRRWHSNPDMASTGQTNAQHQWGCAVLAAHLFPEDNQVLRAAILHDVAEVNIGDVSGLAKYQNAELKAAIDDAEERNASDLGVSYVSSNKLKLIDMLDAYLWVKHHNPKILQGYGWPDQIERMLSLALFFDVSIEDLMK